MMQKLIFIGTVHCNWTPKDELIHVISEYAPDQVLIELSPEECTEERRSTSIRDEMFAVYDWARQENIPVAVFDIENDMLREGVTGNEPVFREHEKKSKEVLRNYSWKDLNNEAPWSMPEIKALEDELKEKYIVPEKEKEREHVMRGNIQRALVDGTNVVVTGTGHLSFFQNEFPDAAFPLRTE